ncbi:sulfotransferase 1C2-like [Littorina saxatilis]|uniref:Sulfotransferase domain-containing protein n=1 Tax=Littorina saxatilis TaxID=31220 RepID=A0AAN9AJY0_9CAEN
MGQCNGRDSVVLQHVTHKPTEANGTNSGPLQQPETPDEDIPEHLELRDRFGNTLYFLNAGDVLLAPTTIIPDARERLTEIKQLELRQDDVIIAGFMKSGNHWVQQIVRMLLQGNTDYKPNTLSFEVFEYIPQHLMTPPDEPRAFFTHLRFHHLPTQVLEKKVKIIHLVRNPKDTFVSMFLHLSKMKGMMRYKGTWDQFFMTMLEFGVYHGDWFDHLLDWEQEIASHPKAPVMVLPYEDLLRDPLGHVQKVNAFLGADRSEDLCRAIVETCKLDTMKQKEEDLLRKLDVFTKDSPGIYRKGQIGDWKNWFTPAQNRIFDQVYTRRMAHSKRTFTFE